MTTALLILGVVFMGLCLLLVPLGLPGTWLMLIVPIAGTVAGRMGWPILALLVALVAAAEAAEWALVRRISARYGGSGRAFWGAILGGLVGASVGLPVPLVGSLVAGVAGTFIGATAAALWETRHGPTAARVGWGAVLGRAASAALKTSVGLVVLVVGAVTLLG